MPRCHPGCMRSRPTPRGPAAALGAVPAGRRHARPTPLPPHPIDPLLHGLEILVSVAKGCRIGCEVVNCEKVAVDVLRPVVRSRASGIQHPYSLWRALAGL